MIIIPMPIFQDTDSDREKINNKNTRTNIVYGPSSYDSKISYLESERETIIDALKHNEELKKELESGNLLDSMTEDIKYYKKSFKKCLIYSIIASLLTTLLTGGLLIYAEIGWGITLGTIGVLNLILGIILLPFIKDGYDDYKNQKKYALEYAEKFNKGLEKNLENKKQNLLEKKNDKSNKEKVVLKDNIDSNFNYYKEIDLLLREKYNLTTDLNEKKELIEKIKENYIKMSSLVKNEDKQSSMKLTLK